MVFLAAALLALVSMFFVRPSAAYIDYIDFRVLALLFCLMMIVAGLTKIGLFECLGRSLLKRAADTRKLSLILVLLCFFSSMLITNDVALITFVPFAVMIYSMAGQQKHLIPVVVMQTIAANLGSMMTPIGNPQNLYLYSQFSLSGTEFIRIMGLPTLFSLALIVLVLMLGKKTPIRVELEDSTAEQKLPRKQLLIYSALFLLCLATVLHLIPYWIVLLIVAAVVAVVDWRLFAKVDYFLLLTFVGFFVFIGNMGNIPAVRQFLEQIIFGRELITGILASQCISNVPAAILLSGFTQNYHPLLLGVNIGGLGTLIASLASLISYKFYAASEGASKGTYMVYFTGMNVLFSAVLTALAVVGIF